ncbi:SRPBCC family protein [Streptacidiphilus rugosus]|uniref:SRPBCC family protein n=1 Tax=Streptacidiphilus rugosus TaxID=405783 RepID=UPI001E35362B|nr:SRPBCC family protein [Streptacidiphilus rugosus]
MVRLMAVFLLTRTTRLGPDACWARLTDWPRHGAGVPFTTVSASGGTGRSVGDVVLARTAAGPLGFDDPMEIVAFTPPRAGRDGLCRLEKRGRVVHGWAELRVVVRADDEESCDAVWVEDIRIRGLPAAFDPITARIARLVFGRALDRVLSTRH